MQLLTINQLHAKQKRLAQQKMINHGFIAILFLSLFYYTLIKEQLYVPFMLLFA